MNSMVTGFPSFTARRLIQRLLRADSKERVSILVDHGRSAEAARFVEALDPDERSRTTVIIGEVTSIDLGVSRGVYRRLRRQLTHIYHLAAVYHLGLSKEAVQALNVGGTRGVVELALGCTELQRLTFWSTAMVCGARTGVVMEEELVCGQTFRNEYEHSKYAAEKIVRSVSRRVPVTVVRPGIVVGDSMTGEIDRYDGPYHLVSLMLESPFERPAVVSEVGNQPLHLVPVDYVVDAARVLSRRPTALSKTFHLVDPAPLSCRGVYELVASSAPTEARHRDAVSRVISRLPWVGRMAQGPTSMLDQLGQQVLFNCRNTLEQLRDCGPWCPPFESYADSLVRYARHAASARRRPDESIRDPRWV